MKGILFQPWKIKAIAANTDKEWQTRRTGGLDVINRKTDFADQPNSPDEYSLLGFDGKVADFSRYAGSHSGMSVGILYQHDLEQGIYQRRDDYQATTADYQTLGWRKTCKCGTDERVPATVLDPFMGTGTTLEVAASLGRRAIGIDIREPYLKLSIQRNKQGVLG